jgi:pyrroloquinoline quinone biosynthesis protein B
VVTIVPAIISTVSATVRDHSRAWLWNFLQAEAFFGRSATRERAPHETDLEQAADRARIRRTGNQLVRIGVLKTRMALHVVVLGSAAGGGVPQWNCGCDICRRAWRGGEGVARRTQASLAISADNRNWHLVNASPDLRAQVLAEPRLWPVQGLRNSAIAGVVVTGVDVDQIGGLLTLREAQSLQLYATPESFVVLDANPVLRPLSPLSFHRNVLSPDTWIELLDHEGAAAGIAMMPFSVPGKESEGAASDGLGLLIGENSNAPRCAYLPACAKIDSDLIDRLNGASLLLFDGTFWSEDEMRCVGQSHRRASTMGHVAISGPDGSLARLQSADVRQKTFIHINNTNPILIEDSAERRRVAQAGWTVAVDGEEFVL